MSKTIYIVTDGEYSDYGIEAVYSSKELADKYVDLYGGRVEEHDLDPHKKQIKENLVLYTVHMDREGNSEVRRSFPDEDETQLGIWYFSQYSWETEQRMVYRIVCDSEERAVKVANEKRVMILSENLWGNEHMAEIKERLGLK